MNTVEMKPAAMRESRDIEWLVNWTLEKLGMGRDLVSSPFAGGGSLGTKVDSSSYSNDGKWVNADAEVIAQQLATMGQDSGTAAAVGLVVHYGRVGTRPDWGASGSGHWEPVRGGKGKVARRYRDPRHSRGLIGFEWEWTGHRPEDLDRMMIEWMAWHACLCDLREAVNPKLRFYVATEPSVSASPWDDPVRTVTLPGGRVVEV